MVDTIGFSVTNEGALSMKIDIVVGCRGKKLRGWGGGANCNPQKPSSRLGSKGPDR